MKKSIVGSVTLLVLLTVLVMAWVSVSQRKTDALVVYCAHDLIFAQEILDQFAAESGIKVVVVGDTEATKSLGLVQRLIREKKNPQCDVFWNNQVLGTMDLAAEGVLEPYQGTGFDRIPNQFKDPEGLWTGFAGRLRVWIVNTNKLEATEEVVQQRYEAADLSRMTIAMPLFGTTLSHFSLLWKLWGGEETQRWYDDLQQRGCRIVPGNATVKNLVAEGVCEFGWTDTDDYFVGLDDGAPVAMLPIRVDGKTICLPNSVAIIKGTKQRAAAEQLVDYLLSEKVELALAHSASRQIPLGPVDESQIPEDVKLLVDWAADSVDVTEFYEARQACLTWLQNLALKDE